MSTWLEMRDECLRAAKILMDTGELRRSVSSSYYSAYCAVAGELVQRRVTFAHGWQNPSHDQLPDFVKSNVGLSPTSAFALNRVLRRLRVARESADYRPGALIDQSLALACVRDAERVLYLLEVK